MRSKAQEQLIVVLERQLQLAQERIRVLEAREWQRYEAGERPFVAMPMPEDADPDENYDHLYDPTGLVHEQFRKTGE